MASEEVVEVDAQDLVEASYSVAPLPGLAQGHASFGLSIASPVS